MASTFTTNIQLEEPARGDDVGTWDTPVNNNMTLLDLTIGGNAGVTLTNANVILNAAQFQAQMLTLSSTLTASVTLTFPTSFTKMYTVFNNCTGSSAFIVTMKTTSSIGAFVTAPPGMACQIYNTGATGIEFVNLGGPIGSYWDYAGSSLPAWVSGCSLPPYFLCNGAVFDTVNYPRLFAILGSSILPDTAGRIRTTLDQGAGRLSSGVIGFSPNTVGNAGGSQNFQTHAHSVTVTDPGHTHSLTSGSNTTQATTTGGGAFPAASITGGITVAPSGTGITAAANNAGTGTAGNMPPAYIGGITMIRAA